MRLVVLIDVLIKIISSLHFQNLRWPGLVPLSTLFEGDQGSSTCANAFRVISYSGYDEVAQKIPLEFVG